MKKAVTRLIASASEETAAGCSPFGYLQKKIGCVRQVGLVYDGLGAQLQLSSLVRGNHVVDDTVPEPPPDEFLVRLAVLEDVKIGMALNEPGTVMIVFTISNLRDEAASRFRYAPSGSSTSSTPRSPSSCCA